MEAFERKRQAMTIVDDMSSGSASRARSRCSSRRLRGVGGDVRLPRPVRRGSARLSRRAGSGSRTGCTPRSPCIRSTPSLFESASSHSTRRAPVSSSCRPRSASSAAPQRLRLREPEPDHRRGDPRTPGGALLRTGAPAHMSGPSRPRPRRPGGTAEPARGYCGCSTRANIRGRRARRGGRCPYRDRHAGVG